METPSAADCLIPMGITSENVAAKYGITREDQDTFAFNSQRKAAEAQKAGLFKQEIIPVTVEVKDGDQTKTVTVTQDEGPRATTLESLAKLKPAFKSDGYDTPLELTFSPSHSTTTAGNSSQTSDGAAVVVAMTRAEAKKRGLTILGRFLSFAVVGPASFSVHTFILARLLPSFSGVPPNIMGVGPGFAIPVALQKAGLTVQDIDQFEINEAFASQALWSARHIKAPLDKINPLGGAIALGHPLGCTGARQIATLLHHLRRTKKRFGVVSMCIVRTNLYFLDSYSYCDVHISWLFPRVIDLSFRAPAWALLAASRLS